MRDVSHDALCFGLRRERNLINEKQHNIQLALLLTSSKMVQTAARRSRVNDEKGKNSNMKVVVRVRPPNSMEVSKQSSTSVRVMDERVLVFDPKDDSIDYLQGDRRRKQPQFLSRRARDLRFMFDRVFDDGASNRDVFEHTTKAIVDGVLGGYNCTVFAYGATGAGKTFTMLGDSANPGVMFLTMMELYSRINACKDEKSSDVAVSYLEVSKLHPHLSQIMQARLYFRLAKLKDPAKALPV